MHSLHLQMLNFKSFFSFVIRYLLGGFAKGAGSCQGGFVQAFESGNSFISVRRTEELRSRGLKEEMNAVFSPYSLILSLSNSTFSTLMIEQAKLLNIRNKYTWYTKAIRYIHNYTKYDGSCSCQGTPLMWNFN